MMRPSRVRRRGPGRAAAAAMVLLLGRAPAAAAAPLADVYPPRQAATIVVDPKGPVRTLAAAIRAARAGDTLLVTPGLYRESGIVVDRRLVILGRPGAVLDGQGRAILLVRADDVVVRGLAFRNVSVSFVEDRAAIRTDSVRGCVIEGNRIEDGFFGIYLARTAACRVQGNVIAGHAVSESLSGNGIHLWYSRDVQLLDNRVSGHRDGIYLEFVTGSRLRGNLSAHNLRYGLHFMFSDSCSYAENTFRGNGAGVAVMYTKHVVMERNRFAQNWGSSAYGLLLKDISDSGIIGNDFLDNTVGIYAEGSNRLRVEGNLFAGNGWAVRIMADCSDDLFTRNDFQGNTFDVATNSVQNPNRFAGNFWDRYRGYDLRHDGTGDVPFHPVRLFSLVMEQSPPAAILLRGFFVSLLDAAEEAFPTLTPAAVADSAPRMRPWRAGV